MWWLWIAGILAALVGLRLYCKGASNYHRPDLTGKIAVVIGGTAGIGIETARDLAKMGARVVITGRQKQRAEKVIEDINREMTDRNEPVVPVCFMACDLSDLTTLKTLASQLGAEFSQIDILVNNAALIPTELGKTKQGFEICMGTNFIGTMYLTHHLMPLIKKAEEGRIVNLSSFFYQTGMQLKQKDAEDFLLKNLQNNEYSSLQVYAKTKLGNVFFTSKLAELLERADILNIKTASVNPGSVRTEILRDFGVNSILGFVNRLFSPLFLIALKSTREGSQTTLTCCCQPFDKLFNGAYYNECRPQALVSPGTNKELRDRVWRLAVEAVQEITGEKMFSDIDK